MNDPCALCSKASTMTLRITPYRTDTPTCAAVKQALSWPGGRAEVPCCGEPDCLERVKRAGVVVDAWPTDPEAEAVVRKVGE